MKTLCCSDKCGKRFECARADINNKGTHYVEDFYSYGDHAETADGCMYEEYWCGELGNYKMFESIIIVDDIVDAAKNCSGCVFENADDSTPIISMCVSCNRINDFARYDWYMTK